MNEPLDLDTLSRSWNSEASPDFDTRSFRATLRRRYRRTLWVLAMEGAVTLALLGWSLGWVDLGYRSPLLIGWSWTFWAAAGGLAWWNRAGTIRRSVASPEAFVRLSLAQARAKVRVVWIVAGLMVVQAVVVTAYWQTAAGADRGGMAPPSLTLLAVAGGAVGVWGWLYARAGRREARRYRRMLDGLEATQPGADGLR